ncbi:MULTISPECIES: hypothetical protein [unclassified Microcoleus]|uniref:hypothetical protein n=1 Tax=unclassified Microcoleus TaxID=2642155 RepID=UPI002FCFCB02
MKLKTCKLACLTALLTLNTANMIQVQPAKADETFNNPRHYIGNRFWTIDWCMPSDCSQEARWIIANAYCREEGYQKATRWRVVPDQYSNQVQYQLKKGGTEGWWQEIHKSQGIFSQIKCQ